MSDDIHYGDIFVITWDDWLASRARLATQFGTSDGDGPPILVDDWKPPRRPPTHSPGRLQHSGMGRRACVRRAGTIDRSRSVDRPESTAMPPSISAAPSVSGRRGERWVLTCASPTGRLGRRTSRERPGQALTLPDADPYCGVGG